ncbi:MAG: hypothetical protein DI628_01835 [Blastochloris viridis]|uniref:Uncharacterized protein n=1 Tax=Blastochloris viridis TaxID=1079 RepID=A0A6N4R809_BLAVI|nr:MAG: hypothetical protein DI628_01835 [Blastochloris viridis]
MTVANFNYTGRQRIKNDIVSVDIVERNSSYVRVRLHISTKRFKQPADSKLVLDGSDAVGGTLERKIVDYTETKTYDFNTLGEEGTISFRFKAVSTDEAKKGTLLAATADIRPREATGDTSRESFFNMEQKDLQNKPWLIDWTESEENPSISINRTLVSHFKGNLRDPMLQALVLPPMFKEILLGIVTRNIDKDDLDTGSLAYKVLEFCRTRFEREQPEGNFQDDREDWIQWAEECSDDFCETPWRNDTTLLQAMLES